jgi:hypothetical protein
MLIWDVKRLHPYSPRRGQQRVIFFFFSSSVLLFYCFIDLFFILFLKREHRNNMGQSRLEPSRANPSIPTFRPSNIPAFQHSGNVYPSKQQHPFRPARLFRSARSFLLACSRSVIQTWVLDSHRRGQWFGRQGLSEMRCHNLGVTIFLLPTKLPDLLLEVILERGQPLR